MAKLEFLSNVDIRGIRYPKGTIVDVVFNGLKMGSHIIIDCYIPCTITNAKCRDCATGRIAIQDIYGGSHCGGHNNDTGQGDYWLEEKRR